MQFDLEIVQAFVEVSKRATALDEINAAFMGVAGRFGYGHVATTRLRDYSQGPRSVDAVVTYPEVWKDRYSEMKFHEVDPVFASLGRRSTPFFWGGDSDEGTREERSFFDESRSVGVKKGLSLATSISKSETVAVTWAGNAGEESDGLKHMFHLIATYYYQRLRLIQARTFGASQKEVTLTARESEVLQWYAVGKSAWDIGAILGVSESTVRFHLCSVRRKFDVSSTVHATALAVAREHIQI